MKLSRFICLLMALITFFTFGLAEGDVVAVDEDGLSDSADEEMRSLKLGDSGSDVTMLQQHLAELCYFTSELSGTYDDSTAKAVMAFQKDFSLKQNGEADSTTLMLIFSTMYRPLAYGSVGEDVKRLQTRLMELGFYTGKISGNYLESTQVAVANFQRTNSLRETGAADTATQKELFQPSAKGLPGRDEPTSTPAPAMGFVVDESSGSAAAPEEKEYPGQLAFGSSGQNVTDVQTRLTELGYYEGPISGSFQGKTKAAVKKFQKNHSLKVDGIIGKDTWRMLFNSPDTLDAASTPRPTATPEPPAFRIVVDVTNQVTTVYGMDSAGEYTVVARQMLCSTGTTKFPSDLGDFTLNGRKANWCYFPKWGDCARYWTRINPSIAFHSVIYASVSTSDMKVSSYKNLGKRASHGCIRLTVADAKWIYDNVGAGTVVTITDQLPKDPELRASLTLAPLNTNSMTPVKTPEPTAEPIYISGSLPPMPLQKLSKNDSSEAVYHMQRKLTELGYYKGKCSGTFLDGTVSAVKRFQKDNGISQTGTATVETLEKLYASELATPAPSEEILPNLGQ